MFQPKTRDFLSAAETESFTGLGERLLREGIAPCHVRRYLSELKDHLSDLVAAEEAKGHGTAWALARARKTLGSDDELYAAMAAQRQLRSAQARAPWFFFGLLPPLLLGLLLAGSGFTVVGLWHLAGGRGLEPGSWDGIAHFRTGAATLFAPPLAAVFVTIAADRQRQKWVWPLLAVLLTAALGATAVFAVHFPLPNGKGDISLGLRLSNDIAIWSNFARFCLTCAAAAIAMGLLKLQRPAV